MRKIAGREAFISSRMILSYEYISEKESQLLRQHVFSYSTLSLWAIGKIPLM